METTSIPIPIPAEGRGGGGRQPERKNGRAVALFLAPAAAVVAAGLIFVRLHFEPPTVPAYSIAAAPGDAVLNSGDTFEMTLLPGTPVEGAIGGRAFLIRGDDVRPWNAPMSVGLDGSVRIAGPVDTLFAGVPRGDWDVAVAVGRPEVLPTAPLDIRRTTDTDPRPSAWRLLRESIHLGPR